jgi:hypothetical protein
LPHLPISRKQSKKALAGATWQDIAQALGRSRRKWGVKLHAWCGSRVEIVLQDEEFDRMLDVWASDMGNVSQAPANKPLVPTLLAA